MNNPIFPEAVRPGRHYSFRADLKLNAWAFVAVAVAFLARWLLHHHHNWGVLLQAAVALTPLLPSLLYVQSIARWIGGMDELQRRIQLQACLFATTGTVFIATALSLLAGVGVLQSIRLQHGLGWEGTFGAIILLYILGNMIFNRRYQ
ncbi:MAG: hypothetical protein ACREIC_02755 [Limisphaerales bacterium]